MASILGDRNSLNHPTTNAQQAPGFAAFKADARLSFVRAYDPKAAKIDGFTHQVLRYRETKKGKEAATAAGETVASKPAKMVTVPVLQLPEYEEHEEQVNENGVLVTKMIQSGFGYMPAEATAVLMGVLEDAQNDLLKSLIDGEGKTVIEWDDISLDKVFAFLTATRASSRMTKESNEAWAKVALLDACTARAKEISDAANHDEATRQKQLDGVITTYVGIAGKLSAAVPNIGMEEAKAMVAMLERAGIEDDVSKSLGKKLHTILNPKVAAGFL